MIRLIPLMLVALIFASLGGCPTNNNGSPPPEVVAVISSSSTSGSAPLDVTFSAETSTTINGGPLTYSWTILDTNQATVDTRIDTSFTHTFSSPGRYTVVLVATDSTSAFGRSSLEVRVQGTGATAAIAASTTAGHEPLIVDFDATGSSAPDDVILDFFWDFDDGSAGRTAKIRHQFTTADTYTVSLRVVTAGGVEATTTQAITVGVRNGSLQFNGAQFATLPLAAAVSLDKLTFEAWYKSDSVGGSLISAGSGALTVQIDAAANQVRVQINGVETALSAAGLAGTFRHIAVVFDAATGGTVYLDGASLGPIAAGAAVSIDKIDLGVGFRGNVGEVRLWSVARTSAEINATKDERVPGTTVGLLGAWSLFEGAGQSLANRVGAPSGVLGASATAEATDPAWSTDGPPL